MLAKLSKYSFEIIAGIAIFVAIVYFLPSSKVDVPDIGELQLSGVDLEFVMDDEQVLSGEVIEEESIIANTGMIDTGVAMTGDIDTGVIAFEPTQEPVFTEPTNTEILPIVINGKDPEPTVAPVTNTQQTCSIPRGGSIRHGESILAYQQRSDDPATCNIQRRVCNDGILNGSYTQSSCKELFGFNVEKQEVVAYNVPNNTNQYIQPTDIDNYYIRPTNRNTANNRNMVYNTFTPSSPIIGPSAGGTYAGSTLPSNQNPIVSNPNSPINTSTSSSTIRDGTVCNTPRGEQVRNGQFVKAYKVDKGFSNLPCEVELRYCVQTVLEGSFQYESCQHYDIAVEDYLMGHYDPNVPSAMQLAEILHQSADIEPSSWGKQTLWDRIQSFVKNILK